jgi:hypothetical protein
MQGWLKSFHGANQAFPAMRVAVKAAVALALGLLVGFEREWSNKDRGAYLLKRVSGLVSNRNPSYPHCASFTQRKDRRIPPYVPLTVREIRFRPSSMSALP